MTEDDGGRGWKGPVGIVALVTVIGVFVLMLMGSQVSGILSTVGAPIGIPGPGSAGEQPAGGEDGRDDSGGGGLDGSSGGTSTAGLVDGARPDLLVIKTGEIALEARDVGAAIDAVTRRIVALGGYVSASERSRDDGDLASVTFRVPADRWEGALAAARGAGDDVLDEHSTTEDVTGKVVDLRARIRNLQATEQAFQSIMDKAAAIEDILDVQAELTNVRGQIEQLTATATRLEEQAAFSTLKVVARAPDAVVQPPAEPVYDPAAEVEAATDQLVDNAQALTTAGIWFGIVWLPILLGVTIAAALGAWVVRRAMRLIGGGHVLEPSSDPGA